MNLWLSISLLCLSVVYSTSFPNGFNPSAPYVDTCLGYTFAQCRAVQQCTWLTSTFPQCVSNAHLLVNPPNMWKAETLDLVSKFFTFHFGMHLTEGKSDRRYYNTEVNECAALCLRAAAGLSDQMAETVLVSNITISQRRCLSFDFFPFELPMPIPPHSESASRGICVLNSETKATARLRSEDTSFTDAELFYISIASARPFSRSDGYYEVRDNRGSGMTRTLDFPDDSNIVGGDVELAWGQSRYGIAYLKTPTAILSPSGQLDCSDTVGSRIDPEDVASSFFGGFTPLTRDSNCPGLITKPVAQAMCKAAGGNLCPTQATVRQLDGARLGCNLDGLAMWTDDDIETPGLKKYARCCANYVDPADCKLYTKSNADFCTARTTSSDCIGYGSGYTAQLEMGYGRLMQNYRARCALGVALGTIANCRQLLMQPWKSRDRCVWCPSSEGGGQCRPGNDFGICSVTANNMRKGFALKVLSQCPQASLCNIAAQRGYTDIADLFGTPINTNPVKAPTPKPTQVKLNCALSCNNLKGRGSRIICSMRKDCIWKRNSGSIYKSCTNR
jgi:hypothetical protein